jgi:hypothetical protein
VEDSLHYFTFCPRVAGAWDNIHHRLILVPGLDLTNQSLLFLAWSLRPDRLEATLTLAVITFTAWSWETRDILPATLLHIDIQVKIGSL